MKKTSKKPTQKALATKLGISPQLVSYHVRAGCSVPLDDIDGWREYLSDIGREGSLPEDLRQAIGRARARLLEAQAIKAERENRIANRELMPIAEAERQASAAMSLVFAHTEADANELPPSLAGRDAIAIFQILKARIEKHRAEWREAFQAIGK